MSEIEKLLRQIIAKAHRINNTTEYAVWVELSGHVNRITVYTSPAKDKIKPEDITYVTMLGRIEEEPLRKILEDLGAYERVGGSKDVRTE